MGRAHPAYLSPRDRWLVILAVGYADDHRSDTAVTSPRDAARHALDLTRDRDRGGTVWHVYDRHNGIVHTYEQADLDHC